jgi:hypothetical protein
MGSIDGVFFFEKDILVFIQSPYKYRNTYVRAHLTHRPRNWTAVPSKVQSPLVKLNITTEPLDNSAAFFFLALLRQTSPSQDEIAGFPIQTKRSTIAVFAL